MLLQHPGTENVPVFQWISSTAVFLSLYSLPPNCISRGTDISLPKNVNHRVSGLVAAEWLQGNTWDHPSATGTAMDKPACYVLLTGSPVPWREGEKHNSKMKIIRLPLILWLLDDFFCAGTWKQREGSAQGEDLQTKFTLTQRRSSFLQEMYPPTLFWRLPIRQYLFTHFAVCCFSALLAALLGSGNKKSSEFWYQKRQND